MGSKISIINYYQRGNNIRWVYLSDIELDKKKEDQFCCIASKLYTFILYVTCNSKTKSFYALTNFNKPAIHIHSMQSNLSSF